MSPFDQDSVQESLISNIRLAVDGDEAAWDRLHQHYCQILNDWADSFGNDGHLSQQDLAQEAWIRVFQGLNSFQGADQTEGVAARFYLWIRQTAKRAMLNIVKAQRAEKRNPGAVLQHDDLQRVAETGGTSPSSIIVKHEEQEKIQDCIRKLASPEDQQIIRMAIWDGHSLRCIANVLGLEYTALRRRYHSILRELQQSFEQF